AGLILSLALQHEDVLEALVAVSGQRGAGGIAEYRRGWPPGRVIVQPADLDARTQRLPARRTLRGQQRGQREHVLMRRGRSGHQAWPAMYVPSSRRSAV